MKIETKTKNINNKALFKFIDDFLMEVFETIGVEWKSKIHRETVVDLIDGWMADELVDGKKKIIQYDVLCDGRNNDEDSIKKGLVKFTLRYRQKTCLNTSEIEYIIQV